MSKMKDNGPLKFSKPLTVYSDNSDWYSFEDILRLTDVVYM